MNKSAARPLRVGVMLNSIEVNAWTHRILEEISRSSFCEISLAVINDRPEPQLSGLQRQVLRVREWRERGLFNRYQRWDHERYRVSPNAFAPVDASDLLPDEIRLPVVPIETKFTDRFHSDDVDAIRAADLDVLLRFGFRIIKGDVLRCARYGVWSYHHGDNRVYRGGPALFWELFERNPVSGSVLQVLTDDLDGGHVLYRSWSATDFNSLNYNRNANYWKSSQFVMRCLRALHERGWDYLAARESQDGEYQKQIYRAPNNFRMAGFLARQAVRGVTRKVLNKVLHHREHWRVIVRPSGAWRTGDTSKERHLTPPPDRFYADPFIIKRDGRNYIFFEDYRFDIEKGLLSYVEIKPDGSFTNPEVVLERDYHLSYPFVFERDGEVYMIPETRRANRIELYRATDFPRKWQFAATLVPNIAAVDATLHETDGKLWLFCNVVPHGGTSYDELHVFMADSLEGPWQAHPANPVVSDVRRSRPAGRIFMHEGKMIRPAQDCSVCYGHAVHLNAIETLTPTEYRESHYGRIGPEWLPGNRGTHNLDFNEDYEVLDAKFSLRKFRLPQWRWSTTAGAEPRST